MLITLNKGGQNFVRVWDVYQNFQLCQSDRLCPMCTGKLNGRRSLGVVCTEEMTAEPLMGHEGE